MNQNLANGRQCADSRECWNGHCNQTTGLCTGFNETTSCFEHDQCDVGLGCIGDEKWPYGKTCQKLRKDDEICSNDYDCDLNYMCWYKTKDAATAKKKTCMKMFSQPEFTVYGYPKEEPNKVRDIIPNERKFA